ncbi:MAG TPA: type III-A CRISPR-associated RAMP protein Csm5 [Candidatus Obscuribacterales bacterium]
MQTTGLIKHQKARLKAKTWTHVHIGSGVELSRWEYFFRDDKLVLLDYAMLAKEAERNPQLIDALTDAADDDKGSLYSFLMRHPDKSLGARLGEDTRVLPQEVARSNEKKRKLRQCRLFTGSPKCYIPGTSVKGALRTAYLSHQIATDRNKKDWLPRSPQFTDKDNLRSLQTPIMRQFNDIGSRENKLFQHVIVRDTRRFGNNDIGIATVDIYAPPPNGKGRRDQHQSQQSKDDIYCEVILSEIPFEVQLILRKSELQESPIDSVEKLLDVADKFYRRVWEREKLARISHDRQNPRLKAFYNDPGFQPPDDHYLLRLGWGSGQHATSVLMDYREFYAQSLGTQADTPLRVGPSYNKPSGHRLKERQPYPFSAKCALANDNDDGDPNKGQPLGWVIVSKKVVIEDAS